MLQLSLHSYMALRNLVTLIDLRSYPYRCSSYTRANIHVCTRDDVEPINAPTKKRRMSYRSNCVRENVSVRSVTQPVNKLTE